MEDERKDTADRQAEILDAALHILHEEGAGALTVRNIADRIGISEPAVYRHFDAKEEIVHGIAGKIRDDAELCVDAGKHDDAGSMLADLFTCILGGIEEHPHVASFILGSDLFAEYPGVEDRIVELRRAMEDDIAALVAAGQEQGYVAPDVDPSTAATIITGTAHIRVRDWKERGCPDGARDRAVDPDAR
ncbi:MAG: TetR/AcrR family transcriptional regulator, partial [Candidatus Nanohaloarchaea archaeon]